MALILILLRIARRATDPYSSLCVFGVAGLLFTHIIENVGMTVNLLPITGIPLPFFSYGGSFLLACSIAVGDRKSTRLNSSHGYISYAVFCLKKKNASLV